MFAAPRAARILSSRRICVAFSSRFCLAFALSFAETAAAAGGAADAAGTAAAADAERERRRVPLNTRATLLVTDRSVAPSPRVFVILFCQVLYFGDQQVK